MLAFQFSELLDRVVQWIQTSGAITAALRVAAIVIGMAVALGLARRAAARLGRLVIGSSPTPGQTKRAHTLSSVVRDATRTVIWVVGGLMVLGEVGIDLKPLLAAAGIGGLAIGFGAQSLVKDVITGVLLLLDDRLRVGDTAELAGLRGTVEEIRLRTVSLRDVDGALHIVPCGSVEHVTNYTREFSFALVDVEAGYREDVDEVSQAIRDAGAALAKDPRFLDGLLEPLEVMGVEELGANGVTVRVRVKTRPGLQFSAARELRRLVKQIFDARGIEIPFPQQTLWMGQPKKGAPAPFPFVSVAE